MKFTLRIAALLAATALSAAHAATVTLGSFAPVFQGIDYTTAEIIGTGIGNGNGNSTRSTAYIVRIDLDAPGIAFTTTPQGGSLETISNTTSGFLATSGTQVAVNGGFFAPCCAVGPQEKTINGLAVSSGNVVSADEVNYPSLLLTADNRAWTAAGGQASLSGVFTAIAGNGFVVSNGVNVAPTASSSFNDSNPRTLIGLDQAAQTLYLVAVDGRQPGYSSGVSLSEEAQLLLALGVWSGINLDGGGSTAMVFEGVDGSPDLINRPSGGSERWNANNFGVYANALPVPMPPTVWMLGSGLAGVMFIIRRRRALGQV